MARSPLNLDRVILSEEAQAAWDRVMAGVILAYKMAGFRKAEIAKRARPELYANDDGSLTLTARMPSGGTVSMNVPPEHWRWNPNLN